IVITARPPAWGPDLRRLLGQLFFEFVEFRTPRGDPFQQLGIRTPDRRRPSAVVRSAVQNRHVLHHWRVLVGESGHDPHRAVASPAP
ncbi:hypothetical protein ABT300_44110, partial [Streptomyces sp. NPDC001027]|uniref:hypothetical protein n=1 Tax=Streptomyces sp. NPDC001027 TaxID=3154771 RepID=UPI003323ECC0